MNEKNKEEKPSVLQTVIIGAGIVLMQLFMSSCEMYFGNPLEFSLPAKYIAGTMLLYALAVSAVLTAMLLLMRHFAPRICAAALKLGLGLMLAEEVQVLFLNSHMKEITGDPVRYDDLGAFLYIDLAVFLLMMLLPFIAGAVKKHIKKLSSVNGSIMTYTAAAVLFMQASGAVSAAVSSKAAVGSIDDEFTYFSYEQLMSLSKENNVVTILEDMLDVTYFDSLIKEYPEICDELEGFTYYPDDLSCYRNTTPSVQHMITGYPYSENTGFIEYTEELWEGHRMPDTLHENGVSVTFLTDTKCFPEKDTEHIKSFCANYVTSAVEYDINYDQIIKTMQDFSFARTMPYALKPFFTINYFSDFSEYFITFHSREMCPQHVGVPEDIRLYEYLRETGLNADSPSPVYTFVHTNGGHDLSEEAAALYEGYLPPADMTKTVRGEFVIVEEYLAQMKKLGVYDCSTIIIIADHGCFPEVVEDATHCGALLIKPANAERKPLVIDETVPMYNGYYNASVLEYFGIDHSEYGISYNDALYKGMRAERIWRQGKNVYRVEGDARDNNNWEQIEG